MAIGKRVIVTHLMSPASTPRVEVEGCTLTTATVIHPSRTSWLSLGVLPGDVVRITSGTYKGVASIVDHFVATTNPNDTIVLVADLSFPSVATGGTPSVRVDPPRTQADVSADVLRLELDDYMGNQGEVVQTCMVELANTAGKYSTAFEARDPIELWIDDGDDETTPAVVLTDLVGTIGTGSANTKIVDTSKNFVALGFGPGSLVFFTPSGYGGREIVIAIASVTTTTNPNDTLNFTGPTSTAPTTGNVYKLRANNHRCFIGRIDTIERPTDTSTGYTLKLNCREYGSDFLDGLVTSIFRQMPYADTPPAAAPPASPPMASNKTDGTTTNNYTQGYGITGYNASGAPYVYGLLISDFTKRRGLLADTAAGQPVFNAEDPQLSDMVAGSNPAADLGIVNESFFDAFARMAASILDNQTSPEPFRVWVDGSTYHPAAHDEGGTSTTLGGSSGAGARGAMRPTIRFRSKAATSSFVGITASWDIREGRNILNSNFHRDSTRTRNRITTLGSVQSQYPIIVTQDQVASASPDVLGQDRFGQLENVSQSSTFYSGPQAIQATKAALTLTVKAKERRQAKRLGIVPLGTRLSGSTVNVQHPTGGVSDATTLGIVGVRHVLSVQEGMTSDFDLTAARSGWDRLLVPISKSIPDLLKTDVWKAYYVYVGVANGSGVDVYSVSPAAFGDTTKETFLFNVAGPGGSYVFLSMSFCEGYLAILWHVSNSASGTAFKYQIVNAYTGAAYAGRGIASLYTVAGAGISNVYAHGIWFHANDIVNDRFVLHLAYDFNTGTVQRVFRELYVAKASGTVTTSNVQAPPISSQTTGDPPLYSGVASQTDDAGNLRTFFIVDDHAAIRTTTYKWNGVANYDPTNTDSTYPPLPTLPAGQVEIRHDRSANVFWLLGNNGKLYAGSLGTGVNKTWAQVGTTRSTAPVSFDLVPFTRFY